MEQNLERYSIIKEKNKREIVLLIGSGCVWKKCTFCDYHTDFNKNSEECFKINTKELNKVTGIYGTLEVINSGSFTELDENTMKKIEEVCILKNIKQLHFESHWLNIDKIHPLKEHFKKLGITIKLKIGIETFDYYFRESYLKKGINNILPEKIAKYFDEVCLLQGIAGQNEEFMKKDIEIGLKYFERVCINIMQKNRTHILPDPNVEKIFLEKIYPIYKDNERIDILLNNTDFGVGGEKND